MATQYSLQGSAVQGVSTSNDRRQFAFGDRVVEVSPRPTPFFSYLSKHRKVTTTDPVFKVLEQRHQWQRRNFKLKGAKTSTAHTSGAEIANYGKFDSNFNKFGIEVSTPVVPLFILGGQLISMKDTSGVIRVFKVGDTPDYTADSSAAAEIDLTPLFTATTAFADNVDVEIIGSSFAEGSGVSEGWKDELFNREQFCQIFKTSIPLFSNTARATELRGRKNEYQRTWLEKIMEHKADMDKAAMFSIGTADESATGAPERRTWGILPYTESLGKVYSDFTYGASNWDKFLDVAEDFFDLESGNHGSKLTLCSRKIATWLNKMSGAGYIANTAGVANYRLNVEQITGSFGHEIMSVKTMYGDFNFVVSPWLRGPYEDYAVAVDMAHVAWRPLSGNGISRDTFITTNVQDNDADGRQDMITTEAGLEITMPERHAILKFS